MKSVGRDRVAPQRSYAFSGRGSDEKIVPRDALPQNTEEMEGKTNVQEQKISPAKKQRLLNVFGPWPAGYTKEDLELCLDLLYRLFSHMYVMAEIRQMMVSDPFDHTQTPRQIKLLDLTNWLEALLA